MSYGVIGGTGLGLGYLVPSSVPVKWFPERRGLLTGVAVRALGGSIGDGSSGDALDSRMWGVLRNFAFLGEGYLVVTSGAGWSMQNPPAGCAPTGSVFSAWVTSAAA
jgi:OFA family oxalate/formate antiporter-like MFS transporter